MSGEEIRRPEPLNDEGARAEEMKHLAIIKEAQGWREPGREPAAGARRGSTWQIERRELERKVREEAVEYRAFAVLRGGAKKDAAKDLALSPRTLGEWAARVEEGTLAAALRGRPLKDSGRLRKNEVIAFLRKVGPGVGVGRIRGVFPRMPRCEIVDLVGRYRRIYVLEHTLLVHELEWTMVGAVWAMDHAAPRAKIAGGFEAVLAVRDLSSGEQILWQAVRTEGAREVRDLLETSFAAEGAPLVMKSDNGSALVAEETNEVLAMNEVIPLLSPPGLPQYNGSVESGIGAMKDRTTWKAALSGRSDVWTGEDLESARVEANEMPRGPGRPSAGESWHARSRITAELRAAFRETLSRELAQERASRGLGADAEIARDVDAEIKRTSIRRALVAHGILKIRRRRIPLPKKLLKRAKISS